MGLKVHPLLKIVNNSLIELPSPSNINSLWNFGSLLGLCLIIQILTGLFLSMHYSRDASLAFIRVSHITRDVNYGWLLRMFHANGASFFFICLFLHVGRGLYYGSYFFYTYLDNWCCNSACGDSYCISRLCFTLRTNIFLRCYCYY